MKIRYDEGTSQLVVTSEAPSDIIKIGRIAERIGARPYSENDGKGNYSVAVGNGKILELLCGEKP